MEMTAFTKRRIIDHLKAGHNVNTVAAVNKVTKSAVEEIHREYNAEKLAAIRDDLNSGLFSQASVAARNGVSRSRVQKVWNIMKDERAKAQKAKLVREEAEKLSKDLPAVKMSKELMSNAEQIGELMSENTTLQQKLEEARRHTDAAEATTIKLNVELGLMTRKYEDAVYHREQADIAASKASDKIAEAADEIFDLRRELDRVRAERDAAMKYAPVRAQGSNADVTRESLTTVKQAELLATMAAGFATLARCTDGEDCIDEAVIALNRMKSHLDLDTK